MYLQITSDIYIYFFFANLKMQIPEVIRKIRNERKENPLQK